VPQQIYCSKSNYIEKNGIGRNEAIGLPLPSPAWDVVNQCYDTKVEAGGHIRLPMAVTISSNGVDMKAYQLELDAWEAAGSTGTPPSPTTYAFERKNKPNTMDLCSWYLKEQRVGGFAKIDKDNVEKVQKPEYISGLQGDNKPVDVLAQTLGATFLHEVRFS